MKKSLISINSFRKPVGEEAATPDVNISSEPGTDHQKERRDGAESGGEVLGVARAQILPCMLLHVLQSSVSR